MNLLINTLTFLMRYLGNFLLYKTQSQRFTFILKISEVNEHIFPDLMLGGKKLQYSQKDGKHYLKI